eukprot:3813632-Rhodomonas_salina.1
MQQLCGQCSRLSVVIHDEQGQGLGLAATSGVDGQNNHRSGNNGQTGTTKTSKKDEKGKDGLLSPQKAATSSKATSDPQKGNTPKVDQDDSFNPEWYNGWGWGRQWHMERYGHIKKVYPDGKRTLNTHF